MKVLLIEDNIPKQKAIENVIEQTIDNEHSTPSIELAQDLVTARRLLLQQQFDLIIFDMFLPDVLGKDEERDCTEELISEFSASKNYQSEAIALTQYEVGEISDIEAFNRVGITLVKYDEKSQWSNALEQKINKAAQKFKCDFIVFCALPKERSAFNGSVCTLGQSRNINGMDCQEASIDQHKGFIVKPRAMGLVNMAIVSTKAIELFQPKIVAMSGICAGVKGESNYLDIIVGKTCWEWQTGKWTDDGFKQEPYQSSMSRQLEVDLLQSAEKDIVLNAVREGLYCTELGTYKIRVAPISSGSSVVANQETMQQINEQHRKMAGLEMEMYSLYEASEQSLCNPLCFGAKAVVDMGDNSKGDEFHDVGCTISARYTALMLQEQLAKLEK